MIPLESFAANAIEASFLALIVAVVSRVLSLSAPLRSALWLLVLVKLLLPPVPVLPAGLSALCRAGRDAARFALEASPRAAPPIESCPAPHPPPSPAALLPLSDPEDLAIDGGFSESGGNEIQALEEDAAPRVSFAAASGRPGTEPPLAATVTGVWLVGLILLGWARMRRVDALRALIREASHADARVAAECASLAARLGIRRPPRIRVVEAPISPFLWACGRPVIVLPAALVSPGREELLRTVLAHELSHIARGDHWTAWIEVAATLGYWWLPTAWLASRAHERAADEAADALAAAAVSTPRAYARSLLTTIELIHMTPLPAAFPGRSLGERDAVRRRLTMLFQRFPATRLSWTARLVLIAAAALALPASPRPLSSQESGDDALAADEPVIEARAGEAAVNVEAAAATIQAAASPDDAPSIAPVAPVKGASAVVAPAAGAPVIVAGPYERGLVAVGAAPADGDAGDVEQRLRRMEERIDALLRELQLIRSQMGPGATGARSPRAAANVAPGKARTSSIRAGTRGATSGHGAGGSSDSSIRATTPATGAGGAPTALGGPARPWLPTPGATPAPTGATAGAAPSADPAGDWLSPPPDDLTEEQRARVEELDRQYRERLLKHQQRYAREREEAIRRIREGKDPNAVEESRQTR